MIDLELSYDAPLARLLDPEIVGTLWPSSDLAALFRHQLATPLLVDLLPLPPSDRERLARVAEGCVPSVITFGDLLHHPEPPVSLLTAAKEFAKFAATDPESPLPSAIASALYYSVLAVAIGHRLSLTTLSPQALREGFTWCLAQGWYPAALHPVVTQAIERLASR